MEKPTRIRGPPLDRLGAPLNPRQVPSSRTRRSCSTTHPRPGSVKIDWQVTFRQPAATTSRREVRHHLRAAGIPTPRLSSSNGDKRTVWTSTPSVLHSFGHGTCLIRTRPQAAFCRGPPHDRRSRVGAAPSWLHGGDEGRSASSATPCCHSRPAGPCSTSAPQGVHRRKLHMEDYPRKVPSRFHIPRRHVPEPGRHEDGTFKSARSSRHLQGRGRPSTRDTSSPALSRGVPILVRPFLPAR